MSSLKLGLVVCLFLWITVFSIKQKENKTTIIADLRTNYSDTLSGRQLAGQYCRACHLFPDPSSLDKAKELRSIFSLNAILLKNISCAAVYRPMHAPFQVFEKQPTVF